MALRTPLFAILLLLSFFLSAVSQTNPPRKPASENKATKTTNIEEPDAVAEQRKVVAVSLLTQLANDARSFRNQALRARIEARAADAFWETDPEKARTWFRRAWEEAETADAETAKKEAAEMERLRRAGGPIVMRGSGDVRSEVLRIIAKRDRVLGEELLQKLKDGDERERKETARRLRDLDPGEASGAHEKRLDLAGRLLADGEIETAMQFAAPALTSVNRQSISFLSALREKNAPAADQAFMSLLARSQSDPASDANTVSGLSSYAFTPFLYVQFSPEGGSSVSQNRRGAPAPALPAEVLQAFFKVSGEILMRPLLPPDQDQTTSGRTGKYLIIKRLLPLFEEHSPEQAAVLKTQMNAIAGDVPANMRSGENRALTRGLIPDADLNDNPLERMQQRLDRSRTTDERDAIYADYAVALHRNDPAKARELVDKISDREVRRNVMNYLDFETAQGEVDDNELVRLARSGELTSIQRIWSYTQAARFLMTVNRTRAIELLEEAVAEARRLGGTDPDRARGLVAAATLMALADRVRAWEIVSEAVKAANAAETFTGEDGNVSGLLRTKQMVLVSSAPAEEFNLLPLFRRLAKDDLNRSIELAKSFTGESPRAVATLAIARSVLEKSPADQTSLN